MENSIDNSYRRLTLKLSAESHKILISECKDKKREIIIKEALLLYSQGKKIDTDLLEILKIIRHIKIALEYTEFNLFRDKEDAASDFYKKNYKQSIGLLAVVEDNLNDLRMKFSGR
jgi:hypothetical protein